MLRLLRGIGLLLLILTTFSQPARADIWDWFGELSGPKEATSRGNIAATLYCRGTGKPFVLLNGDDFKNDKRGPCIFADIRRFKNKEDDRFFPARFEVYESGPTYLLAPPFEIGFGIGLIHFDSSGVKTNHLTLSFPRLIFKPLMFFNENDSSLGFFQYYFRETRIIGDLTQDDFRPKPGVKFNAQHDLVPSTGFIIDAVAFVDFVRKHVH